MGGADENVARDDESAEDVVGTRSILYLSLYTG
jgi:hypothetical protein